MNRFQHFFNNHKGLTSWKVSEYLEIYHDHFKRFYDSDVCVMELGIWHGGSLEMWKSCFGPRSKIYGIDSDQHCKAAEQDQIDVFIGDITDKDFRDSITNKVPEIDIFIDDGGHNVFQQVGTLQWILPRLSQTGVYLCEDISYHGNGYFKPAIETYLQPGTMLETAKEFIDYIQGHPNNTHGDLYSLSVYKRVIVIEKGRDIKQDVGFKIPGMGGCFTGKEYLPNLETMEEFAEKKKEKFPPGYFVE